MNARGPGATPRVYDFHLGLTQPPLLLVEKEEGVGRRVDVTSGCLVEPVTEVWNMEDGTCVAGLWERERGWNCDGRWRSLIMFHFELDRCLWDSSVGPGHSRQRAERALES